MPPAERGEPRRQLHKQPSDGPQPDCSSTLAFPFGPATAHGRTTTPYYTEGGRGHGLREGAAALAVGPLRAQPLQTMDALAASHANLVDAIRVLARWQGDHTCGERAGALRVRGATRFPTPYLNALLPVGAIDVDALLAEAGAFFPDRRCMAWTRGPVDAPLAERLTSNGWLALGDMPIMAIERDVPPVSTSLELRVVRSAADLSHLVEVLQDAYDEVGLPPPVTAKLFCNLADGRQATEDGADLVVAYDGATPVAAAMAITRGEAGGLYWVGTRAEARGRGAGTAVATWATHRAFERGARCVTLQASQAGEPVYLRLGYREVARYGRYLSPPPAER